MSEQMSFVYVQSTGHVLSVITCTAASKTPLTSADLATPTLAVRNVDDVPGQRFDLTPDLLSVFTGDDITGALLEPRGYSWDDPNKKISSLLYSTKVTATFDSVGITVNLPAASSGPTNVLVAYPGSNPSKSLVAPGTVANGSQTVKISIGPLAPGIAVLILAAGYPPVVHSVP
jgi:hypothetical protein